MVDLLYFKDRYAFFNKNGKATRMIRTDADSIKDKELQLKYAQQAQILEQVRDSIISTDLDGNIVSWNLGSQKMLGYSAAEVIGRHMSIIHRQEDLKTIEGYVSTLLNTGELNVESYLVPKSNDPVLVSVSLSLLKDESGNTIGMIGVSQDITQRKKAEAELLEQKNILHHQAHHDALTELPNRVLFNDRLSQAIEKAKRHKKELALFFIDLDRFKQINDSLGHVVGDKVLQEVSNRLKAVIRREDTIARLGGDEFTVLVEDLKKGEDSARLAQKILHSLANPLYIDGQALYISSSIGISLYPQDDTDIDKLLMCADAAMYKAKDEGRNNFQFYSAEMTALALEQVVMEASLRKALEDEEFIVYYQPQVNGESGQLIGMEALVRWKHPTMGLVLPAKFIPIAEETGLIVPLDQWVMKTAMTQQVQWYRDGLNPGVLSLNLSMKLLYDKECISILSAVLEETACLPEWIELEITEEQMMINPEEAIYVLNQISEMGIKLAIDDFGTGYTSLSYLKNLPINRLKIDQSLVRNLPDDAQDVGISKAMIILADSLGLNVITEGVETQEQKDFLIENGCKNIQGYFYAKPMPSGEMEVILKEQRSSYTY